MSGRRQVPGVKRRGAGWQVRLRGPDGREVSATFDTQDEAAAWREARLADRRRGTWVDPGRGQITLAEWVEVWGRGQVHLRPRTRARDDAYLKARTLPALGGVPMAAVTTAMVERFRDDLVADGLAPATVTKHLQILSKIFAAAVDDARLHDNPVVGVSPPRVEWPEARFLDLDELARLEACFDGHYRDLVGVNADLGLRIGELAAQRVRDLDLEAGSVRVRETAGEVQKEFGGGHSLVFGPPKSAAGRRTVPTLTDESARVLAARISSLGLASDDLVWAGRRGATLRPNNFRDRFWGPAVAAAGLAHPLPTPHALRHTAVARWIAAGVTDEYKLARWAGHTSTTTIYRFYGHLLPEDTTDLRRNLSAQRARPQVA